MMKPHIQQITNGYADLSPTLNHILRRRRTLPARTRSEPQTSHRHRDRIIVEQTTILGRPSCSVWILKGTAFLARPELNVGTAGFARSFVALQSLVHGINALREPPAFRIACVSALAAWACLRVQQNARAVRGTLPGFRWSTRLIFLSDEPIHAAEAAYPIPDFLLGLTSAARVPQP